jgi:hypothetical protein
MPEAVWQNMVMERLADIFKDNEGAPHSMMGVDRFCFLLRQLGSCRSDGRDTYGRAVLTSDSKKTEVSMILLRKHLLRFLKDDDDENEEENIEHGDGDGWGRGESRESEKQVVPAKTAVQLTAANFVSFLEVRRLTGNCGFCEHIAWTQL